MRGKRLHWRWECSAWRQGLGHVVRWKVDLGWRHEKVVRNDGDMRVLAFALC